MAFAVPVIKKDYDIYGPRRRSAPASSLNKMTPKYPHRRRVISATYAIRRPTVSESNDSVLSQSVERRHVRFGVCQEFRYRREVDYDEDDDDNNNNEEEDEEADETVATDDADRDNDSDLAGSIDSGRSSLDSREDINSKECINETTQPRPMPPSILRRPSQDISSSSSLRKSSPDRPKTVRTVLQFLVAKCAPKKN